MARAGRLGMRVEGRSGAGSKAPGAAGSLAIHLQSGDEGFLRDFDLAELPHALLALFLPNT